MSFLQGIEAKAGKEEEGWTDRKRRAKPVPLIAAFLSILMPGLGHVYCHRWFRGVLFFLFSTGFTVLGIVSAWAGFAGMTFLSPLGAFFYLAGAFDAYRCSKRVPVEIAVLPSDRWSIALFAIAVVVFLASFAVVVGGTVAVKYIGQPVTVETKSMAPALTQGDKVLANRQLSRAFCFRQGDLVAVFIPGYKRAEEVRRVIALPGQNVAMMAGMVQVDGRLVKEDYANYLQRPFTYRPDDRSVFFPEITVPEGSLFLLSDVRDLGLDSREWGPVEESRIIGRVDFLFYPLEHRRQFAGSYLSAMTRKILGCLPRIDNGNGSAR